jgi:hypothetical protein
MLSSLLALSAFASGGFKELKVNVDEDLHPVHPHQPTFGVFMQRLSQTLDIDTEELWSHAILKTAEPLTVLGRGGPENSSEPQQIHLALTNDVSEMLVKWVTKDPTNVGKYQVWYGNSSGSLDHNVQATTSTYKVPTSWFNPLGWQGWIHTALLTGLTPGQRYVYRVGGALLNSSEFAFNAAPTPHAERTTSFAIYGDQGTDMPLGFMTSDAMIEEHQRNPFDAVFVCGDLSYAGVDSSIEPLNISKNDEWVRSPNCCLFLFFESSLIQSLCP